MPVDPQALQARFEAAQAFAAEGGAKTLEYFQPGIAFEKKSDNSPVTIADRSTEECLRALIASSFPEDAILGEEFPERPGTSAFRWILDPIDGTKSFICGVPLYATLIGVECDGVPSIGVIELPALKESLAAVQGGGAWWQRDGERQPARVGTFTSLSDGLFATSEAASFAERGAGNAYQALESRAYVTRTWGDAYGYALVATGRAVAMVDPILNAWDVAAILPILQEAGGIFCNWQGEATIYGGDGVGTVPAVLDEVIAITQEFPPAA